MCKKQKDAHRMEFCFLHRRYVGGILQPSRRSFWIGDHHILFSNDSPDRCSVRVPQSLVIWRDAGRSGFLPRNAETRDRRYSAPIDLLTFEPGKSFGIILQSTWPESYGSSFQQPLIPRLDGHKLLDPFDCPFKMFSTSAQ